MRGLGHPLVQRNSCTTWIGPAMGVELVELLSGHRQLQDRKLALGVGPGPGRGRRLRPCGTCCPQLSVSPALSLHSTSPAELSSGNRLATEADHGQSANHKAPDAESA